MEYSLEGRRISFFLVILYTNVLAAESMWIWTQGCVTKVVHSRTALNKSDNLPHTCFRACGKQSLVVALQENRCSCDPISTIPTRASACTSCERNPMVTCGNYNGGYWSLYKKALPKELTEHAIPSNVTGCVIKSHGLYRVDNCSKTGIKSLCVNVLFNDKRVTCDSGAGKWSPRSCINAFDKLLNRFVDSVQGCRDEYWIGLFSLKEQAIIETTSSTTIDRAISPTNVDVSPSETSTIYSKMIDSSEVLIPYSTPSDYSKVSLIQISSFQTDSSVSLAASVTKQVSPVFTDRSIEIVPSSPNGTYLHEKEKSTTILTESRDTHLSKLLKISPTKQSHSDTSAMPSKHLHSSFTVTSHAHVEQSAIFITKPLSHLPFVSQSVLHNSSVIYSVSNIIHISSSIPNNYMPSYIPTTNTMSEFTSIRYSFASTSISNTLQPRTYTSVSVAPKPSSHLSMISSQRKEMDGMSPTTEPVSPTVTPVPQHISPKTSFIIQKSNSETDLVIALTVVGAIAVLALAAIGIMAVYMKRSLKNLRKAVNRTTTFTDDPPNRLRGEVSLEDMDDRIQRNNTYSDLRDATFCPRGTRSDLRDYGGNRPSILFNGRPAIQNEYVLY